MGPEKDGYREGDVRLTIVRLPSSGLVLAINVSDDPAHGVAKSGFWPLDRSSKRLTKGPSGPVGQAGNIEHLKPAVAMSIGPHGAARALGPDQCRHLP